MIDILFTFAPIIFGFVFAAFAGYLLICDANNKANQHHYKNKNILKK